MNIALFFALPLLAAFLLQIIARISPLLGRYLGPVVVVVNIIMGLLLWREVAVKGAQVEFLGGFAAPLGIVFYADQLAALMIIAISGLTLLLWPKGLRDATRESALTLLLMAGACGIALSADLFNLFVFYELIAVASYGLVTSAGSGEGYIAGLRYLILSAAGSAMALLGIALIYSVTGTLNLAALAQMAPDTLHGPIGLSAFALMLIGFGVKAEFFPVNTWVPEVYASTTTRVSGLLSGVVSKLAMLILLKLLLQLFATPSAQTLLLIVGMLTLVTGELAAFHARDLLRLLAYSSIAQLGMVAMAFSVSGSAGILAGLAVTLHHLLAKPALFLLAEKWGGQLQQLHGAAKTARWSAVVFVFLSLSLIGVPPLPGFWAKYLLVTSLFGSNQPLFYFAAALLLVTTIIEASYLIRVIGKLYAPDSSALSPHRTQELLPAMVMTGLLVLGTVFMAPLTRSLSQVAQQSVDLKTYFKHVHVGALAMRTQQE
jgi:formate hydrogenlyase subunit 3/multisubunit Na+/H+ antiporter MnhD subunit